MSATSENLREFYEERAAIREFDGGLSRSKAESLAQKETKQYRERSMMKKLETLAGQA